MLLGGLYIRSICSVPSLYWKHTSGGSVDDFLDFKKTYKLKGIMVFKHEEKKGIIILHIYKRLFIYSYIDNEFGTYMAI